MLDIDARGYVKDAEQVPTPNRGGSITPHLIVMHYTAGWTSESAVQTLTNPASKASAHFVVDTDGSFVQLVSCGTQAWHAGPSRFDGWDRLNDHSIGIELVNPGFLRKVGEGRYQDDYGSVVAEGRSALSMFPGLVEAKHPRVGSGTFYWPAYPIAQLDTAEQLVKAITAHYAITDIVSHEEIDTRGWKTDPGPAFPMQRFRRLLQDRSDGGLALYRVTASKLNMRTGPGTNFATDGQLEQGVCVMEHARKGDWVQVSSDHWVHGAYLKRVT